MGLIQFLDLAAALTAAILALLSLGGVYSDRLDVLTHFTPIFGATGLVSLLTSLGLRLMGRSYDPLTIAACVAALAIAVVLMVPEWLGRRPSPPGQPASWPLKIIQFNLWRANVDTARTTEWIRSQSPDILVVEEAVGRGARIIDELADCLPYRSSGAHAGYGSTLILSHHPLVASGDLADVDPGDFSGAWARIIGAFGDFTVIGLHLTWPIPPRLHHQQSRRVAERLDDFDRDSLIIAGDFNATPWSFTLRRQDKRFGIPCLTRGKFTWPAGRTQWRFSPPFPFLPLDHIYAGPAWRIVSLHTGPRLGSDHLPVVATLARAA